MQAPEARHLKASGPGTLLVVNEDVAVRYLTTAVLRAEGFWVHEATTGAEALRIAAAERPDLILLDVQLPDLSGLEVARQLKAEPATRAILVVHLSGVSVKPFERAAGLDYGADAYLTLPIEDAELVANVRALLRLQRTAQDAIRGRDDFLAVAAHELRTPLSALQLSLQLLHRKSTKPDALTLPTELVRHHLDSSLRQLGRLRKLLDTLLDVSRMGQWQLELERDAVELSELVEELCLRFEPEVRATGSPLHVNVLEPVVVRGDRLRLEQVMTNLVSNALKYGKGNPVRVSLWREDLHAALSVEDAGIGIAQEDRDRIFGRFERATGERKGDSFGLGLHIAKQIVSAHAGSIDVKSTPGEGSTFTVRLPLGPDAT